MRPLNSKERTTLVWQFVFIFFGLCVLPVSIIFFSYFKVPNAIQDSDRDKLAAYSDFERTQKLRIKTLVEIDSCLTVLAQNNANSDLVKTQASKKIVDLSSNDSSALIKMLAAHYGHHYEHVQAMLKAADENKSLGAKLNETQNALKDCKQSQMSMSGVGMGH